jgi:two-component system sensor kinase FixL
LKFLAIKGRVVDAIKQVDWDGHPLGPAAHWSPALRSNLYTILNSAAPKILLWGQRLSIFYNDAYAKLVQRDDCVGIGSAYPDFRPGLWPRVRESVEAALRGEGSVIQEFRIEAGQSGAPTSGVFHLFYSPVLDEDGRTSGVLVDIYDMTDRKAIEENLLDEISLLNALFSTTPVLIAYASAAELKLEYVNSAFGRMLDDRPLIGRRVEDAIPEVVEQDFLKILEQVRASGQPWEGREVPVGFVTPGESEPHVRFLDFVYQPMHSAPGSVEGILFSGYDVTDRRNARKETERLRHELLHSSRMSAMGTMAVTIAHELNQPLTAAANYLAAADFLARQDGRSAPETDALRAASDQVLRAGIIVRRMRSLVQGGQARTASFDLERSIGRAIELVRASGGLEDFAVDVAIAPDCGRAVGDDVQIEQVLVNLLRNAAEASEGSQRRAAGLEVAPAGDDMIEIRLRDWGPGLPPERLDDLFGPIGEPSDGPGLGVGLSLCRTIVEAHGGKISARNGEDGGAVLSFTLPAAMDPAEFELA